MDVLYFKQRQKLKKEREAFFKKKLEEGLFFILAP